MSSKTSLSEVSVLSDKSNGPEEPACEGHGCPLHWNILIKILVFTATFVAFGGLAVLLDIAFEWVDTKLRIFFDEKSKVWLEVSSGIVTLIQLGITTLIVYGVSVLYEHIFGSNSQVMEISLDVTNGVILFGLQIDLMRRLEHMRFGFSTNVR
ncbi:MAG: hypothetical protein EBZ48_16705 [Proteobacteria bacterium]|nr:hypothetical protein [Pseudomonadota bacterium]